MTDGAALLAAILANPDEDTPRLMYADWLQENGQEARAEFIRVQCEWARTPEPRAIERNYGTGRAEHVCIRCDEGRCRYHELQGRAHALIIGPHPLIYTYNVIWFNSGNGTDTWNFLFRPHFRRGFVEKVTCTAADWLQHGDAILAAHPVTKVRLTTVPVVTVKYEDPEEQYVLGEQIGDRWYGYHHIDCIEKKHFAHKPMGYRTLAVLWCRWPGVEFDWPAPAQPG